MCIRNPVKDIKIFGVGLENRSSSATGGPYASPCEGVIVITVKFSPTTIQGITANTSGLTYKPNAV